GPLHLLEQADGLFERRGAALDDFLLVGLELVAKLLAAPRRHAGSLAALFRRFARGRGSRSRLAVALGQRRPFGCWTCGRNLGRGLGFRLLGLRLTRL